MKKSNVYTKTGDKGKTGLVGGERVSKNSQRIHTYGDVDELNSHLGYARSLLQKISISKEYEIFLGDIQNELFNLGSNLACSAEKREVYKIPQTAKEFILKLEKMIDQLDEIVEPLKHFILPGGDPAAAYLHIARTVCRRVERNLVAIEEDYTGYLPENALIFVNRLSDFFFVFSRYINHLQGQAETKWNL